MKSSSPGKAMLATLKGTLPSSLHAKSSRPRGKVSDADLKAVRDAGYTDANVMEIVALVAMYSMTNFFNNVFDPEKDFPAVTGVDVRRFMHVESVASIPYPKVIGPSIFAVLFSH